LLEEVPSVAAAGFCPPLRDETEGKGGMIRDLVQEMLTSMA